MALHRTYRLKCNTCGAVHGNTAEIGYSTPRRARAAAKHDGWAHRVLEVPSGSWYRFEGRDFERTDTHYHDYCPACIDAQDKEADSGLLAID